MLNRVTFLVDGFNLHFSVRRAQTTLGNRSLRWLDVKGLLESYLSVFGREARLEEIHFFTAVPDYLHRVDPHAILRHRNYLKALVSTGLRLHVASFKRKRVTCSRCGADFEVREEKETDVALGVKAIELLHLGRCDTVVFVSGDTEFAPAIRTSKRLFPAVQVCVAFPHARFNAELQQLADRSFRIRAARYAEHQLPDPIKLPDGRTLHKPTGW